MAIFRCFSRNLLINNAKPDINYLSFLFHKKISTYEYTPDNDPTSVFFKDDIQSKLKELTRVDLSKVFRKRKLGYKKLDLPEYTFMTDEQLQKAMDDANNRAETMLQIPPAVAIRKDDGEVIHKDPALKGLETSRFVFTDITFGISNVDRLIVVRETDGTLKKAEGPLRDRMNQVYFPIHGREIRIPKMFEESRLKKVLDEKEYEFVLDRASLQFEPDDPEYQKVTSTTYLHLNENHGFDCLRSTRHFGSMVFFLTWFKNIDNLLLELIETSRINEATVLIELYSKIHNVEFGCKGIELVEKFIADYSHKKGALELAVQALKEIEKEKQDLAHGIKAAHGRS
ncbi:PREDICTED: 28S ribosomal protein S22, mitochondrial [Nicrophorus vespilloides]|uniref:28S ribosomal protein S22, mitochondrial n=1 Tax=Nicrophorus vespilloides TaxID=110193 RepID=A0ABM1NGQ3_NICVS|nr:PREDICTED: 28S ribosomal protein S22, mitochondrial [Nicrophorus vespilloides]